MAAVSNRTRSPSTRTGMRPFGLSFRYSALLLGVLLAVDEAQLERDADLPQHHVRQQAGVTGIVVECKA